jgi:GR25 family glycosyltransferase involved in LPS biosynthesis
MKLFLFLFLFMANFSSLFCDALLDKHLRKCENKKCSSIRNIDFVYLINLDRRPDRLNRCLQYLAPYGIVPYKFSAIDARTLSNEALSDVGLKFGPGMDGGCWVLTYKNGTETPQYVFLGKKSYGRTVYSKWMSKGAIGCFLSHLSILKDAYDSHYNTVWVLEDDFAVHQDPRILSDVIDRLDSLVGKEGWDVCFTDNIGSHTAIENFQYKWRPDSHLSNFERFQEDRQINDEFQKIGSRERYHSVIWRRSGIKKILDYEKTHNIFLPWDHEAALPDGMRLYNVRQPIVSYFERNDSDIQPNKR